MHEMSIAVGIREICEQELERRAGARLTGVGLTVGVFSGVEIDSLEFCLGVVLSERFDGVRCEISTEAGEAVCFACGKRFEVRRAPFDCPDCGVAARGVSGGETLQVTYLDVE